jgi:predicted site-specific integrase-resolvase
MSTTDDRRPRLTTTEVVEAYGVARPTLMRWVREGKIPEPARDPESGWPVWQQPELDAIARVLQNRKKK